MFEPRFVEIKDVREMKSLAKTWRNYFRNSVAKSPCTILESHDGLESFARNKNYIFLHLGTQMTRFIVVMHVWIERPDGSVLM